MSKVGSRLRQWWRGSRVAARPPATDDFRVILETVQAVGVTLAVDGRITFANDFLLRLTGWRRDEVLGRNWFGLFVPEDSDVQRLFRASVASGRIFPHHENEIRTRDGGMRTIAWDNVLLRDADGAVAGTASIGRDVTDERAAVAALARSEAFAYSLLEASADCVKTLDLDGRLLTMNGPGLCAMEVEDPSALVGCDWPAVWVEGGLEAEARAAVRSARLGQTARFQGFCRTAKGKPRWWDVAVSPVRGADERIERLLAVSRDVTAYREQQQERARLATRRHEVEQRLASYALVGEALRDTLTIAGVARAFLESGAPAVGASAGAVALVAGDDRAFETVATIGNDPPLAERWSRFPNEGALLPAVVALRGGEPIWCRTPEEYVVAFPPLVVTERVPDVRACALLPLVWGGRHLGALTFEFATARDFPEDERAFLQTLAAQCAQAVAAARDHEAQRAARAAAEAERRRLRLVIDRMPFGVVVVDASGRTVHHNALAPRLLGHPVHEVDSVAEFSYYGGVHADGRPYAPEDYPMARALGGEVVEQELTHYRRGNGSPTILSISAAPVYEDGRLVYAVAAFQDVAAREAASEALHAASEALREGDRRKDEFLAMLAHELRNPLAPLRNAAEILRRSKDPSAGELARAMIERQLAQMVRLVDDLLDVSRIATGKLKLHRDVLRLDEVVERAVETSRPRIDAQGHRLFVHLPHEPVRVRGDAVRLAQVLTNLLNNAAKYTDPGGTIVVQVRAPADGRVAIEVRDTGIGLAPEALAGIFDLFAQVETAEHKAQGGLGIGLTIARRIVELHGGTIRVASEGLGRGATFTVELPVADPVAAPAVADGPGERRHSQCRVVVADDNRDTADSLAIMLRLSGHEVHVAYDGEAAVELVRRHRPDVALVDIGMPRLDGYGVARHLRAEPWGGALVLAALTGWGQHSDRDAAAAAGFDHHFTKPVDPAAVEALLNGLPHCSRPASWTRLAAGE